MKNYIDIVNLGLHNNVIIDNRVATGKFPIYNGRYLLYIKDHNIDGRLITILKVFAAMGSETLLVYSSIVFESRTKKQHETVSVDHYTNVSGTFTKFHHSGPWIEELPDAFNMLHDIILSEIDKNEKSKEKEYREIFNTLEEKAEQFRQAYNE